MANTPSHRPHRPTLLGPAAMGVQPGGLDPAEKDLVAHTSARLLIEGGRTTTDADALRRLITLAETEGVETLAELWAGAGADTLPGALWRLYLLRTWVYRNPQQAADEFAIGRRLTPVLEAVAGVAEPPGPEQVRNLTDAILAGVFTGDFAVALERAGAFARIVAVGRAHGPEHQAPSAARMVRTAEQLEAAAGAWRLGELH